MQTNPELVKDGLRIRVDFFKPSGKWYAGGEVNVGDARLWQGDQAFQRAIIENQKIMNGDGWIGGYHVVTSDLPELWAKQDYCEFNHALFPADKWSGLGGRLCKECGKSTFLNEKAHAEYCMGKMSSEADEDADFTD